MIFKILRLQKYCFFLICANNKVFFAKKVERPLSLKVERQKRERPRKVALSFSPFRGPGGFSRCGLRRTHLHRPSALAYPSYVYLNYVQVGSTRGLFSVGLVSPTACPVRSAKSRHFSTLSPRIRNPRGPRGKFSPDERCRTHHRKFSTSRHAWFFCHRPCPSVPRSSVGPW